MNNSKRPIDAVRSAPAWRGAVAFRLELLRQRVVRKEGPSRSLQFLGPGKRLLLRFGLILPKGWHKTFGTFAGASVLLLLFFSFLATLSSGVDLSKRILGSATAGFEFLEAGKLQNAIQIFEGLTADLAGSEQEWSKMLELIPLGVQGDALREVGQRLTRALGSASKGYKIFQQTRLTWNRQDNSSGQEFYQDLKASREYLVQSVNDLTGALAILDKVNPNLLPGDLATNFGRGKALLERTQTGLQEVTALQSLWLNLLGGAPKTYLLIFQNNAEMRATGGFIGTYGLLEFNNGRARILKIESIYNLDGQLKESIAAPGPLQRQVSRYWGLRDSNWFVDFPTSAEKVLGFLKKESGVEAEGIISFTPDVFEELLKLTGPVPMPEYGAVLTSDNFRATAQYKTSVDYDKELNQPKKFLADFAPRLLEGLQSLPAERLVSAYEVLSRMVAEKQILVFSREPNLQAAVKRYQADGGVYQTDGDYLAIFHSNVGGGKTDQRIIQKVEKQVSVLSGGLAIVKLKITRTNLDFAEKFFPKNLDFMRVLVPRGAQLLEAQGFDDYPVLSSSAPGMITDQDLAAWDQNLKRDDLRKIYIGSESNYTVFSNWLELEPGQTKSVELTYEFFLGNPPAYTHLLQKQPGGAPFLFRLAIKYLPGKVVYFYPAAFSAEGNTFTLTEEVQTDKFYGIIGE